MLVEVTNYYALEGLAAAVLLQRRAVTNVRVRLGLSEGRILSKVEGPGPDVRWECEFPTRSDFDRDMAVRASSSEFQAARASMSSLLLRFERHLEDLDEHVGRAPWSP